jgi:DNA-directed RNA polymerase specialized sigma24 family protein
MSASRLSRYRAERLLRKDFAGLRAKVLAIVRSQLRAKGITLDASDLEACYAQAWHGLYATVLDGETVESPSAWLVLVTFRRAIDESRSASRIGVVEGEGIGSFPRRLDASANDLAAELDDRALLRHVFEGMRASLSKRECEAAALCYLQGLTRAEAAERMGISEARMGKLMEGAGAGRPGVAGKVGGLLETIKAGGWCEQQSSLMRAYAFGILDPEGDRHALAVVHCRECPACRAYVASLRGLASILPLPLLSPLALAGAGGAGATVAKGSGSGAGAGGAADHGVAATTAASRGGVAGAGGAPATRLASTGLRLGGKVGGGWSGLAGSLTVKLAVTAAVMFGAGYALLGSRAPGNRRRPSHVVLAPSPIPADALSQALFAAPPVRTRHRDSRHTTPSSRHSHPTSAHGTTSTVKAIAPEFGPERTPVVAHATASQNATRASSPGGGSASGEFGLE